MTNEAQPFDPGNRLIVALDVPDRAGADAMVDVVGHAASFYKIGLELFWAEGPSLVRDYVKRGHRVMLDLKLHDIPATVERAVARVADLGVELLTVHSAGGRAMMQAAVRAARAARQQGAGLRILAVTVLTSLSSADLAEVGITQHLDDLVIGRSYLAMKAGCDGVVCSAREAGRVRAFLPANFLIVTPGVRPLGAAADDQARVMSPGQARQGGADLIVCGRPIRDAADPGQAARNIAAEIAAAV